MGEVYEREPFVVFYNKSDCSIVPDGSGFHKTWILFERFYPQHTFEGGITLKNVVQLAWLLQPDGEPEERYFYAEDYGLVGWRSRSHGFSNISEMYPPDSHPDNNREVISCLGTQAEPLRFSSALNNGPLPEPYTRRVK